MLGSASMIELMRQATTKSSCFSQYFSARFLLQRQQQLLTFRRSQPCTITLIKNQDQRHRRPQLVQGTSRGSRSEFGTSNPLPVPLHQNYTSAAQHRLIDEQGVPSRREPGQIGNAFQLRCHSSMLVRRPYSWRVARG
jgi:hypothetical protein